MKVPVTAYIGLGSNQGNRLGYLQTAVDRIFQKVGSITGISSLYETEAQGFDGADFLNACIGVRTYFPAEKVLKILLQIEQENNRKRSLKGYTNRTLDLDLLFYGAEIIRSKDLRVPHPRLTKRQFVLQPLQDIAPDLIHPETKTTPAELLSKTPHTTAVQKFPKTLKAPSLELDSLNYLTIEGNIGAGKTSLATMISQEFNAKLITERFKDNPFLPKFYRNKARYAFPLEMSFLADRYQQLADDIAQYDLFNDFIVSDYEVYKSIIFAQVTLQQEEIQLYKRLFHIMYKDLTKPDLYLYLYQNTERLLANIKKRGRDYEQNMDPDYLKAINRGYLNFIKSQDRLHTKIIDVSDLDFVNRREDYLLIIRAINAAL